MVIEPVQLGPCVIGEDCQFDPGVYLAYPRGTPRCRRRNDFEETILGRGCRVRSNCVIYRHSALGDRCQVAHNVVVREHVTVGDGCVRIAMVAACGPRVPDLVVGIGGGSSLDAAKLLMVLTEAPEIDLGDLELLVGLPAPVLAASLVDTVTHAVEGHLPRLAKPLAAAPATGAGNTACRNLKQSQSEHALLPYFCSEGVRVPQGAQECHREGHAQTFRG